MPESQPKLPAVFFDGAHAYCQDTEACESLLRMGFGARREEGLKLHMLEALYLAEKGKVEIFGSKKKGKKLEAAKLLKAKAHSSSPSLSEQYILFKAFRSGGQIVRFSSSAPLLWRVYARGVGREQDRPQTLLFLIGKKWSLSLPRLESILSTARALRLEPAFAYVKDGKPSIVKLSKLSLEA